VKDFHCRDAGLNCDFVARGNSNDEIVKQAGEHAKNAHHMSVSPDLNKRVEALIHDEGSEAHRRSMAKH
jgi:predicted small metal-binding protein